MFERNIEVKYLSSCGLYSSRSVTTGLISIFETGLCIKDNIMLCKDPSYDLNGRRMSLSLSAYFTSLFV